MLDDGLEALGNEMFKLKVMTAQDPNVLMDRQAEKLCNYVRATVIMAEQERKTREQPPAGDLVAQIADALKSDPELRAAVQARLKEGRAS